MIARFTHDGNEFDIGAHPYAPDGLVPPPLSMTRTLSSGAGNLYAGGKLAGEQAKNRNMSFRVKVLGASVEDIKAKIQRLQTFVYDYRSGGPLWFEYSYSDLPEPVWGTFGAPLRYKVVAVSAMTMMEDYNSPALRAAGVRVTLSMIVAPIAEIKPQRVMLGRGSLVEDRAGTGETPRGITRLTGSNNLIPNPIFGNLTSYLTGWTSGAGVGVSKNTDRRFVYRGDASASVFAASATNNHFYASAAVVAVGADHYVSILVKRPDGSAPTTGIVQVYYNSGPITTTIFSAGDGWYILCAKFVPLAAVTLPVGIKLTVGYSLYVGGITCQSMAVAVAALPLPIFIGDDLGCAWAGTAHNSETSSSTAALKLSASLLSPTQGSLAFSYIPSLPLNGMGANAYLFDATTAGAFRAYLDAAGTLSFVTNANAVTASLNGAAGVACHFLFTWTVGVKKIYLNGAEIASATTHVPVALGDWLSFGDHTSPGTNILPGTIAGVGLYDHALSAAEAAALAADSAKLTDNDQMVNLLPYFWTKDGDGQLDNCNDSSRDNWGCLAGVPGSHPPAYEIGGVQTSTVEVATHLSLNSAGVFFNPGNLYLDSSGSADAGSSGGAYLEETLDTLEATYTSGSSLTDRRAIREYILGHDWYALARLRNPGGAATVEARVLVSVGSQSFVGAWQSLSLDNSLDIYRIGPIYIPEMAYLFENTLDVGYTALFQLQARRPSGASPALFQIDFADFVPSNLIYLGASATNDTFILREDEALAMASAYSGAHWMDSVVGDDLEIQPMAYNNLVVHIGAPGAAYTVSRTLTLDIHLRPRYALL
jgi:hypothetical protein